MGTAHEVDDSSRSVGEAVVGAVAGADSTDPLDVPVLYESIDPDALGALTDSGAAVRFRFAGYVVHVDATAGVELRVAHD